jgi:hypothetical protein
MADLAAQNANFYLFYDKMADLASQNANFYRKEDK